MCAVVAYYTLLINFRALSLDKTHYVGQSRTTGIKRYILFDVVFIARFYKCIFSVKICDQIAVPKRLLKTINFHYFNRNYASFIFGDFLLFDAVKPFLACWYIGGFLSWLKISMLSMMLSFSTDCSR